MQEAVRTRPLDQRMSCIKAFGFVLTVGSSRVKLVSSKLDTKFEREISCNLFFRPCRFSVDNSGHLGFKV